MPRALAFLRRFAPLWLIWLLIFLLPASRQPLQLQLFGSPFTPNSNPPWTVDERFNPSHDSFALVERNPGDLNARIWRFSQMLNSKTAGFDKMGEQNRRIYRPSELIAEAEAIQTEFKGEKWLGALSMRIFRSDLSGNKPASPARTQRALEALESAARLEPDNAFYPLIEAEFWRRQHDFPAMWRALNRAATRKTLDSHNLKWARAIVKAHDAARPLILEEREALWRDSLDSGWVIPPNWPTFLAHEARKSQQSGDHRRAIEIGVILGSIGDLMQRPPNARAMAISGHEWKSFVNSLVWRSYPPNLKLKPATWARDFSAYAKAHGRPDVAALRRKWSKRQSQLFKAAIYSPNAGRVMPAPPKTALERAEIWRIAGAIVGVHLLFVAAFWLLVNLVMWRGIGAPSSAKDRVVPALSMALLGLGMALWSWQQFEILDAVRWTPGKQKYYLAVGSVAVVAFFGAPFLLAVWAAGTTLWRHKAEFLKPARIETELRLSPRDVTILKSGPAIFCTVSLLLTLGFWLSYLLLVALDIPSFDLLAWLPDDGRVTQWNLPIPTEALFAPIIYCLFLDFLGFLVWFNKWRYYAGKESRPLTHGGLRWWKESLGVYLVLGSAIYLGVALAGWPSRAQAWRELETRMVRGELPS